MPTVMKLLELQSVIADFIMSTSTGYSSKVEKGGGLSGGQRQRML